MAAPRNLLSILDKIKKPVSGTRMATLAKQVIGDLQVLVDDKDDKVKKELLAKKELMEITKNLIGFFSSNVAEKLYLGNDQHLGRLYKEIIPKALGVIRKNKIKLEFSAADHLDFNKKNCFIRYALTCLDAPEQQRFLIQIYKAELEYQMKSGDFNVQKWVEENLSIIRHNNVRQAFILALIQHKAIEKLSDSSFEEVLPFIKKSFSPQELTNILHGSNQLSVRKKTSILRGSVEKDATTELTSYLIQDDKKSEPDGVLPLTNLILAVENKEQKKEQKEEGRSFISRLARERLREKINTLNKDSNYKEKETAWQQYACDIVKDELTQAQVSLLGAGKIKEAKEEKEKMEWGAKLLFTELAIENHLEKIQAILGEKDRLVLIPYHLDAELKKINLTLACSLQAPTGKFNPRQAKLLGHMVGKIFSISSLLPFEMEGTRDAYNLNRGYLKQILLKFEGQSEAFGIIVKEADFDTCDRVVEFAIQELKSKGGEQEKAKLMVFEQALARKVDLLAQQKKGDVLLTECSSHSSQIAVKQACARVILKHKDCGTLLTDQQFEALALQLDSFSIQDVLSNALLSDTRAKWLQSIQAWNKTRALAEYVERPEEKQDMTDLVAHLIQFETEERKHDEREPDFLIKLRGKAVYQIQKKISQYDFESIRAAATELASDSPLQGMYRIRLFLDVINPGLEELRNKKTHTGEINVALRKNDQAIAAMIQAIYQEENKKYSIEKSVNYPLLTQIISETKSDLGIKNLTDIALNYLPSDSDCQIQFVYQLSLYRIKNISIIEAYALMEKEQNKLAREMLCHAILMHSDANNLSRLQLFKIVKFIRKEKLEEIKKKNSNIAEFLETYLTIPEYKKALEIAEKLEQYSGQKDLLSCLQRLSPLVYKLKEKNISVTWINDIFKGELIDLLPELADQLKRSADRLTGQDRENKGNIEAAKRSSIDSPPLAIPGELGIFQSRQERDAKQSMTFNEDSVSIIQNIIMLISAGGDGSSKATITGIIDQMVEVSGIPYIQEICMGRSVITEEKNAQRGLKDEARKFITDHLLCKHNITDSKAVDDLVESYADPDRLYQTFSTSQQARSHGLFALAIFKSSSMRKWLLTKATKEQYAAIADVIIALLQNRLVPDLFDSWSVEDFNAALLKGSPDVQAWVRHGMLSSPKIVERLSDDQLNEQVKQLDLRLLTLNQLKALSKRSRIACLNNLKSWEQCKQTLGDHIQLLDKAKALTGDFVESDIRQLTYSEAGLILAFNNQFITVTKVIRHFQDSKESKELPHFKQTAWKILEELDSGFLKKSEETQHLHNAIYANKKSAGQRLVFNCREELVQASFYKMEMDEKTYELALTNSLVAFDLKANRPRFLKYATPYAIQVAFSSPSFFADQIHLDDDLAVVAERGFQAIQFKMCLDKLNAQSKEEKGKLAGEQLRAKGACINLLGALPDFLKKTTHFEELNISIMIGLCEQYNRHFPNNADAITAALRENTNYNDARKVLGPVIFSNQRLLNDYFKKKKDYQVPHFWLVRRLEYLFDCIIAGMTAGLIWDGCKHFIRGFNPLSWIGGSSSQAGASYFTGIATAIGAGLLGVGVSPGVAGLLVPILMGAAGFVVGGLIVSTLWSVITTFGSWTSRKWREARGHDITPDSQVIMEIIINGLKNNPALFLASLKNDFDFRSNVAKTLSFIYDNDINLNIDDPAVQKLLINIRDDYRYTQRYLLTRFIFNVFCIATFGLIAPPPVYVAYRAKKLCAAADTLIPPVQPSPVDGLERKKEKEDNKHDYHLGEGSPERHILAIKDSRIKEEDKKDEMKRELSREHSKRELGATSIAQSHPSRLLASPSPSMPPSNPDQQLPEKRNQNQQGK